MQQPRRRDSLTALFFFVPEVIHWCIVAGGVDVVICRCLEYSVNTSLILSNV